MILLICYNIILKLYNKSDINVIINYYYSILLIRFVYVSNLLINMLLNGD